VKQGDGTRLVLDGFGFQMKEKDTMAQKGAGGNPGAITTKGGDGARGSTGTGRGGGNNARGKTSGSTKKAPDKTQSKKGSDERG